MAVPIVDDAAASGPASPPTRTTSSPPNEFQRHIDDWRASSSGSSSSTTSREARCPDPPPGQDVVFEIDVVGAARIKELYPDAVLVFVDAPDRSVQEERLRGRGDSEERIAQRLAKAEHEVGRAVGLPFVHIVNDDLDRALKELESVVAAARDAASA